MHRFLLLLLTLVMTACASKPPLDMRLVNRTLTPKQVVDENVIQPDQIAMWGGMILSGKNYQSHTQLEVLAYPVDEEGRPDRDGDPMGRFILSHKGYLETATYAQGRWVTTIGPIRELRTGKVGETDYHYPVLDAQQLHLWPKQRSTTGPETQFHFGLGVIFH